MKTLRFGDKLTESELINTTGGSHIIHEIVDVAPVKYDANEEAYVVCAQKHARYMLIRTVDINGDTVHLMIPCSDGSKCANTFMLADAIIDQ